MPYLTVAEAAAGLPSDTALSSAEIADYIARFEEDVETITGEIFEPRTMARVFDGNGEPYLPLDRHLRIVTALEYLYGNGWSDVSIQGLRIKPSARGLALGNLASYSRWPSRNRAINRYADTGLSGGCGVFPAGSSNVRVTGTWGRYETVPLQIKHAIRQLIRYAGRCDDPANLGSNAFESESIPNDRAFTLRKIRLNALNNQMTGYPDVDAILVRFRPGRGRVITVI
jgi:hypothetical protein